jgi:membrane associated rhomboid family serine protease
MTPLVEEEKHQIIRAFYIPLLLLYVMWLIYFIETVGGVSFSNYGIYPRRTEGLAGILFAPLLHDGFYHLFDNSIPLLVLTTSLTYFYKPVALRVLLIVWLADGVCVWLAGRSAYHIGASGVIYGEASFLFFSGVIRKNMKLLAISLLTVFLYGGMIWGIFPLDVKISWEAHLFGGLTGTVLAFVYSKEGPTTEEKIWEDEPDDDPYWEVTEEDSPESKPLSN